MYSEEINNPEIANAIKSAILEEFKQNNRKGLYAFTQKIMAYNSNKIEGSTMTSEQTASLFDTGTITSNGIEVYRAKDIEEMTGHFKMFNQMLKTIDEPLSEKMVKSFHYQLKNGVFEDQLNGYPVGEYKNRQNIVSDIITTTPNEVSENISRILDKYNNSDKKLIDIVMFHSEYEKIHPFQDGNGRTGRMIIVKQCFDSKIVPIIIKDEDKYIYYRDLHAAQVENNYEELESFFRICQMKYYSEISNFIEYKLNIDKEINQNLKK